MSDENNARAWDAGALLSAIGYGNTIRKLSDIPFISVVVSDIAKDKRSNIVSESAQKCVPCSHLGNCELGNIFESAVS
jgi:hypothetical protein